MMMVTDEQDADTDFAEIVTTNEDFPTSIWKQLKDEIETPATPPVRCFFNWELLFPQLRLLQENIEIIKQETKNIPQVRTKKQYFPMRSPCKHMNLIIASGFLGRRTILRYQADIVIRIGQYFPYFIHSQQITCKTFSGILMFA